MTFSEHLLNFAAVWHQPLTGLQNLGDPLGAAGSFNFLINSGLAHLKILLVVYYCLCQSLQHRSPFLFKTCKVESNKLLKNV